MGPTKPKPSVFAPRTALPRGANLVLRCTSSDASSRSILRQINRRLAELGVEQSSSDSIEIVLAEALNNIVEHAYADRVDGPLELRGYVGSCSVRFEIVDEGRPMPGLVPPTGRPVPDNVDILDVPEGGFGWLLIRSLAREFNYRREGGFNLTSFELPIDSM